MILYHYCSNSTFYKIVTNHQLWMTDISRSNDYNEMKLFVPGIFYEVEDEYKAAPFDFSYKKEKGLKALKVLLHESDEMIHSSIRRGIDMITAAGT